MFAGFHNQSLLLRLHVLLCLCFYFEIVQIFILGIFYTWWFDIKDFTDPGPLKIRLTSLVCLCGFSFTSVDFHFRLLYLTIFLLPSCGRHKIMLLYFLNSFSTPTPLPITDSTQRALKDWQSLPSSNTLPYFVSFEVNNWSRGERKRYWYQELCSEQWRVSGLRK